MSEITSYLLLAYLDPGSGSILLQVLIAGLLGIGVAVRIYWRKITGALGIKSKKDSEDEQWEDSNKQ